MLVKVAIPKQIQFKIVPNLPEMLFGGQQEVHYIGGSEVLPPPLEPEEESAAIDQLESKYAADARALLIEHNLRLVVYIAKKFDNTGVGVEDLISIGTIGLIKAINTFNKDKNIKLATYASRCIENAILSQMRLWFQINPPRAKKNQNGVFWHKFPRTSTSFVPLRTAM